MVSSISPPLAVSTNHGHTNLILGFLMFCPTGFIILFSLFLVGKGCWYSVLGSVSSFQLLIHLGDLMPHVEICLEGSDMLSSLFWSLFIYLL